MKFALNGATTINGSLKQDVEAAADAGFQGLEIWLPKLNAALEQENLTQIQDYFLSSGIKPLTINSLERINGLDRAGRRRMLIDAERMCRLAVGLGAETLVVVPSPGNSVATDKRAFTDTKNSLEELLELSQPYNLKIALEFLGFANCSVNTLKDALHLVRSVENPRLGLVVDAFHFYVGGSSLDSLRMVRPEEIHIFHINDCEHGLLAEITDDRRLYPGLGVIPLDEMLEVLLATGYEGYISVELFRPEYWKQPVKHVARESFVHAVRSVQKLQAKGH